MAMPEMGINVVADENGTYIAPSQRPDGSWRKTRKVKPGYVPQEEVPTYESVGTQWIKSKPSLPPGVYEESKKEEKKETLSKSAKKNEKRKQKRKDKKESSVQDVTSCLEETSLETAKDDELVNTEKRLKNVKKKLRQIEELKQKLASGEITELSEDQRKKVARERELKKELKSLES